MQEEKEAGMAVDGLAADAAGTMPELENSGETEWEGVPPEAVDPSETDIVPETENSGQAGCGGIAAEPPVLKDAECAKPEITAAAKQVAELEAENESLKNSFEPLYTEIGRNFYEKQPGYELAITGAVEKLNQLNGRIHDNYLLTLRLRGIRYCPKCENIVDDDTVFCGECGTRIDPVGEVDEQSVLCGCCGAVNDRKNHFCIKCGQKLEVPEDTFQRCPSCGTQLPMDAHFCEECGTKLS